jgi:hypothetical protein
MAWHKMIRQPFLGQLLPFSFGFVQKSGNNMGKICMPQIQLSPQKYVSF